MAVHIIPLTAERFPAWFQRSCDEYEADLIATGEDAGEARRRAIESMDESFPGKIPNSYNAVFDVADAAGVIVGYLWVGQDSSQDARRWWIWDIVIDTQRRGEGLGRATMQLAEEYARSQGALTMGLSVFGFNRAARGLYESLGYETLTVKMRKNL